MLDRPNIRNSCTCPLCQGPKDRGLLACWPCFNYFKLDGFSEAAEYSLDMAEERLAAEASDYAREKGEAERYDEREILDTRDDALEVEGYSI